MSRPSLTLDLSFKKESARQSTPKSAKSVPKMKVNSLRLPPLALKSISEDDSNSSNGSARRSPSAHSLGSVRSESTLGVLDSAGNFTPDSASDSPTCEPSKGLSFALNNMAMSNADVLDALLAMEDVVSGRLLDSWCPYRFLPSAKEDEETEKSEQPFRPYLLMRKRSAGFDSWCKSMRELSLEKLRDEQDQHKTSENAYEEENPAETALSPSVSSGFSFSQRAPPSPHKLLPKQGPTSKQQQQQLQMLAPQPVKPIPGNMMHYNMSGTGNAGVRQKAVQAPLGNVHSPPYSSPGSTGFTSPGVVGYETMDGYLINQKRLSGGFSNGVDVGVGVYDSLSPTEQGYVHSPQLQQSFVPMEQFRPRSGSGNDSYQNPYGFDTIAGPTAGGNSRNTGDAYAHRQQFGDQPPASLHRRPSSALPTRTSGSTLGYYLGL